MEETSRKTSGDAGMVPDFSTLENLEQDGDSATATMAGSPMNFIRADDGRWYVRLQM